MAFPRRLSWNAALRDLRDDRAKVPAGLISARVRCEGFARFQHRPLVVGGRFDRAAIMAAAVQAARGHQERFGGTWGEAMSVALKGAWQAARIARQASRH